MEFDPSATQIAPLTHEDLAWWSKAHTATADQLCNDPELMIYEDRPQCGYFKAPVERDGPNVPVMICRTVAGGYVALRGFKSTMELVPVSQIWPRYAKARHLIPMDAYYAAVDHDGWPDAAPAVPSADGSVPINHNAPPEGYEALKQALEEETRAAVAWNKARVKEGGIKTQEDCNRASDWRDRIAKLRLQADKLFTAEKEPSLRESQRVDDKWSFRKPAKDIEAALKTAFERFLLKKDREQQEAARKALAANKPIEEVAPVKPVEAVGTEKTKRLSTKIEPVIRDMDAVFAFVKDRPEVIEFMNLTVRRLRALGIDVPGVVEEPVKKVRT